jgi:hypothetical protein
VPKAHIRAYRSDRRADESCMSAAPARLRTTIGNRVIELPFSCRMTAVE